MTARKTIATLRAGPSKIRTEMEAVYHGDHTEKGVLARLVSIGYTEKSAMAAYGWHYVNTMSVAGAVLPEPTFGTKGSRKPVIAAEVADSVIAAEVADELRRQADAADEGAELAAELADELAEYVDAEGDTVKLGTRLAQLGA